MPLNAAPRSEAAHRLPREGNEERSIQPHACVLGLLQGDLKWASVEMNGKKASVKSVNFQSLKYLF